MYDVYVLYSDKSNIHYTGYTSDLNARLKSHNELATKGWTKKHRPWRLVYKETYSDKKSAMAREKWLKSGIGRTYIKNLNL